MKTFRYDNKTWDVERLREKFLVNREVAKFLFDRVVSQELRAARLLEDGIVYANKKIYTDKNGNRFNIQKIRAITSVGFYMAQSRLDRAMRGLITNSELLGAPPCKYGEREAEELSHIPIVGDMTLEQRELFDSFEMTTIQIKNQEKYYR